MRTGKFAVLLCVLIALLPAACSSPASRYMEYRMNPDIVSTEDDLTITAEGLPSPATIYLDAYAVPHIWARDERSCAYALGYMHGRDRRFQLETMRLLASGRMRELIGDKDKSGVMIRLEATSRLLGLERDARSILDSGTPEERAILDAYAAGINAADAREPQPMEFKLLDYVPPPWQAKDSAFITALVSFGLNKNWEHELARLELILHQLRTGSSVERALAIWKPRFDLPPHLIGEKPAEDPFAGIPPIAPELVEYLTDFAGRMPAAKSETPAALASASEAARVFEAFTLGGSRSNNWAMDGAWTGTGKSALSSDPHMPHMMPPLGYLAHVKCEDCGGGGYEIIGGGFVGMPAITFGTNGRVAWGPTSNWADVADLYVEKPVPGRPGYYYDRGEEVPFETREEVFRIRKDDGNFGVEKRIARTSRHGVLVNDFVDRLGPDFPLVALKRSYEKGKPVGAMMKLYRARDVTEARRALDDFSAMIGHWALADEKGNIAYAGSLILPNRTRHLGTVPVPGWTGTYEWEGFVPQDKLPWIENPPAHFLGTANNQVVQPESLGYPINFEGDVPHRFQRIIQVLGAGKGARTPVEVISELQRDDVDLGWPELRPVYAKAIEPLQNDTDETVAAAARALLAWDGACAPDSPAPTIFNSLNAFLLKKTMEDEVGEKTMTFMLSYFNIEPFAFSLLGDPANPAWDDRRTRKAERAEDVIAETFREAAGALEKVYGKKLENWRWEKAAPFEIEHPFGTQKALAGHVNRGPFPTHGAGNTVFKNQFMRVEMTRFPIKYGPVLRVAIDLSDMSASRMSIPGGQSGRPSSKHYDDILPLYLEGKGVPMEMNFEKIETTATGKIRLQPVP